jgi:GNAT superfamily N-acetyltransferase
MSVAGSRLSVIRTTTLLEHPSVDEFFVAIDDTWPAEEYVPLGPVVLRRCKGAGMRVSSASVSEGWKEEDLRNAESKMQSWGQIPSFVVRTEQHDLDAHLGSRGYRKCFEVMVLSASSEHIASQTGEDPDTTFSDILLEIQRDIWQAGGHIEPPRFRVMERVETPKTYLLGRIDNQPVGTGFVALSEETAMLHALEVHPDARRKGLGARLTGAAARWALEMGAKRFALLVTEENHPARALYGAMGMEIVGRYHYRMSA